MRNRVKPWEVDPVFTLISTVGSEDLISHIVNEYEKLGFEK